MGFREKLRMANLFPGDITPPAMNNTFDIAGELGRTRGFIQHENEADRNQEMNLARLNRPRLEQVGQQIAKPVNYAPPNYGEPQVDKWRREDLRDKQQLLTGALAKGKLDIANEGLDIKREGQAITKDLGQQRIDNTKTATEGKLEQGDKKLTLDDWKAKHPQGKLIFPKGGNVALIDPITGEAHDTGINTGTVTDAEKIRLTGSQARETKATIPGRAPVNSNADLPTQKKVGSQLEAQKLINTHPEWANFIKIDPNSGLVIVTPPGNSTFGMGGGPDKAIYDQITSALYPKTTVPPVNEKPKVEQTTQPADNQVMKKTQKNSAGQTRELTSNDGGKTWMRPDGKVVK